jgi:RND superfamily putative drug exporter
MHALLRRVGRLPGGRRGKWLVLAAWLIVAVALGPLAGKLGDVESSGPNAFLPRGAESARVNTELERFRTDTVLPAVVVYTGERAGAAADADRAALARFVPAGLGVAAPVPSDDGKARLTVVPLDREDDVTDTVDRLRDVAGAHAPPGVQVAVGGPAASLTDSVAVFDGLDATLLLATASVVAILLLLTYRSPLLWLLPLVSVGFAAVLTQAVTYLLARHAGLPVDPQSSGVLMVLVFGVGTDYALLLIARYREELHRHEDRHAALRVALGRSGPAVLASAATIAVGLCCLALADVNSARSLGLVGAVGVVCAFLAMVTVLPALLVVTGRWVFWPFVPRYGTPVRAGGRLWPVSVPRWRRVRAGRG